MVHVTRTLVLILVIAAIGPACRRQPRLSDAEYREAVVAFHTALAALQTSQEVLAREQLDRVVALAPHEPAGWANVGLLLLRQQEMEGAIEHLRKAEELAPDDAGIQRLLGLAFGRQGDLPAAIRHWQRALELEPDDPMAAYALAMDLEREGGAENEAQAQETLDRLVTGTGNLIARIEFARLAAKRGDGPALARALGALQEIAPAWPDDIRERFTAVQQAAASNPRAAGQQMAFLRNVLMRLPDFRRALSDLSTPREEVGEPLARFLVLENPPSGAAAPDTALTFTVQPTSAPAAGSHAWVGVVWPTGDGPALLGTSDGQQVSLTPVSGGMARQAGGQGAASVAAAGVHVAAADLDYDYRTDLVLAGPNGLRILQQLESGEYKDVTGASKLPPQVIGTAAAGVWPADVDVDGDLDLVVATTDAAPHVLRNNGDGTFTALQPFGDVARVRGFAWADFDGEGVPDAAFLLDDGSIRVLLNGRAGSFGRQTLPRGLPRAVAIAVAEVTGDARLDLLVLAADGAVVALSHDGAAWAQKEVGRVRPPAPLAIGHANLLVADVDNNAAADLVVSGPHWSQVLLGAADGTFAPLASTIGLQARAVVDVTGDGRLELVGVLADGRVATASSRGEHAYHWQVLKPRAATVEGDQRINSFGIGGEVEVRTGLHLQRQPITAPVVHVGLGGATQAEVTRLLWPNGTLQSEFNLAADATIDATQRLKGSCPWLFAWNGREMAFVTDVLWRSPLGLRINAQDTADVLMTEDRVKVRGDQLAPRNGVYDLRITAELWETHFFDLVSLQVVDHPAGTEVWVDERFGVPPPSADLVVTGPVQPFAAVRDDEGRNVSDVVADRDDRHLSFAGLGRYQGLTRRHAVELELPEEAPRRGPLWLVAQGWVYPTDSSINVAISQGAQEPPRGLQVEVADSTGRFRTVVPNLGFPAGKDKTILLNLDGMLPRSGARRVRLTTNMEIYWDRLGWAVGRPDVALEPAVLRPQLADLRYRGYSVIGQPDRSTPERPRYVLEGTTPRWRDLEGYHTRFGDVRELVQAVDDRYVIMNAGDELRLEFPERPAPAEGLVRTFFFISDGWEKDGDYNTTFSRTVLPLPTHDSARYDRPPGRLEDDPVYLKHPRDFAEYHTRYVAPDRVRDALRPPARDPRR